ncbi:MAG: hypothetical protein ACRD96_00030, partial [Bryobacteraceae bacterium]
MAATFLALDYDSMAARLAGALDLQPGEKAGARYDPAYFSEILEPLRRRIPGLVAVKASDPLPALDGFTVWIALPLGPAARALAPAEQRALVAWVDGGGARREIHFHWMDGSRHPDGLTTAHPQAFDDLYFKALDIDYAALDRAHARAIGILRQGTTRIRTPAGTDLMFRIGARPFNRQNGDASPRRARDARVRIDRHIEYPAGVLRVAPVEESASGVIVLPEARFGDTVARKVALQIDNGRITRIRAEHGLEAVEKALASDAARRFREFGLGFNPVLAHAPGSALPYYGYGAGVVRLSLGDNEELGGSVRGGFVRWFFFPDATVFVVRNLILSDGRM